jgi:hypothetical protein
MANRNPLTRQEIRDLIDTETKHLAELENHHAMLLSRDAVPPRTLERFAMQIQDAKEEIEHLQNKLDSVSW